jgi:hypothetical protein
MELYAEPYDPERPVLCFDAMPDQRRHEVDEPLLAAPGEVCREDYEYERKGPWNVLLTFEPLTGRRHVQGTEPRTNPDVAQAMQELAQTHCAHAKELRVVLENLSTHTPAALYQTLASQAAWELARKLSCHDTPKYGRWLTMAECAFSVLSRQGLPHRLPTQERVQAVVQHWTLARTEKQLRINWQFTTDKARDKFQQFYPLSSLWLRTKGLDRANLTSFLFSVLLVMVILQRRVSMVKYVVRLPPEEREQL